MAMGGQEFKIIDMRFRVLLKYILHVRKSKYPIEANIGPVFAREVIGAYPVWMGGSLVLSRAAEPWAQT